LPVTVYGELYFGALNSSKVDYNLNRIKLFVEEAEILGVTNLVAEVYAKIKLELEH
jgi:predicted nucleic acid-binding protein